MRKTTPGGTRYYYYDAGGKPVLEYTTYWETMNVYLNGRFVFTRSATANPLNHWIHSDHLGSPRLNTDDYGGAIPGTRQYFYPFGEGGGGPVKYQFTGQERDPESGLDYFKARYYSSPQGRFTSPDLLGGFTAQPASLNKYAYALNNPLRYVDADGNLAIPFVIPIGGAVIGAAWGGIDAWMSGDDIAKGILSGGAGGLAASVLLLQSPFLSGAVSGAAANLTGQSYDWATTTDGSFSWDWASIGRDAGAGALCGRAVGGVVKGPKGLIVPRPGRPPDPLKAKAHIFARRWEDGLVEIRVGKKTQDAFRGFALGGLLGVTYKQNYRGLLTPYGWHHLAALEAEAERIQQERARRLQPQIGREPEPEVGVRIWYER